MRDTSAGPPHPARYEIHLKGHLASRWANWFDGMTLSTHTDGTTLLEGAVVDQAALHGLLAKLRDIGLPLLSVTQVDTYLPTLPGSQPNTPRAVSDSTPQGD